MSHKERCQALFKSTLLILKNATIIIPIIEGMFFTIWDLVKPQKKEKTNGSDVDGSLRSESENITDTTGVEVVD